MELENRRKILNKFNENPNYSGSFIAKQLNLPKTTVCAVLKRFKQTHTIARANQLHRKTGTRDKNLEMKVLRS